MGAGGYRCAQGGAHGHKAHVDTHQKQHKPQISINKTHQNLYQISTVESAEK